MGLRLYNTMSRALEDFQPLDPEHVRFYACGPTVYDRAHVGNARANVVFDLMHRVLKHLYPKVTFARNITDVDDKIIEQSLKSGETIAVISDAGSRGGWDGLARQLLEIEDGATFRRAVDDFLKQSFDQKSIRWGAFPSPQKGFRSTGQEAVVGASLRLRRPPEWTPGQDYQGDVIGPLIRDLGAILLFRPDPLLPILAQYGKKGTAMDGRDLHVGDLDWGVLPPAAPRKRASVTCCRSARWSGPVPGDGPQPRSPPAIPGCVRQPRPR